MFEKTTARTCNAKCYLYKAEEGDRTIIKASPRRKSVAYLYATCAK